MSILTGIGCVYVCSHGQMQVFPLHKALSVWLDANLDFTELLLAEVDTVRSMCMCVLVHCCPSLPHIVENRYHQSIPTVNSATHPFDSDQR